MWACTRAWFKVAVDSPTHPPPPHPTTTNPCHATRLLPRGFAQLLAPARSGKSSLLKVLAGRVPRDRFDGSVWYGGQPASSVNVNRLVAFVGQSDVHLPLLTVRVYAHVCARACVCPCQIWCVLYGD